MLVPYVPKKVQVGMLLAKSTRYTTTVIPALYPGGKTRTHWTPGSLHQIWYLVLEVYRVTGKWAQMSVLDLSDNTVKDITLSTSRKAKVEMDVPDGT